MWALGGTYHHGIEQLQLMTVYQVMLQKGKKEFMAQ
jgi:hypothetical protein